MQVLLNGNGSPLKLDYPKLKTLTGLTISEALTQLSRQLEPAAYKKVTGGGKELTDIKPAWLTEELTRVFGLVGVGWYYNFDEPKLEETAKKAQSGREYISYQADILNGYLIYRLTDGDLIFESEPVRATGGSDNEVKEYAIRGAVTNMLGAAASKLCWQLFVYKGEKEGPKDDPKDEPKKVADTRPWYYLALDYGRAHPVEWAKPMSESKAGLHALDLLKSMIGADKWWSIEKHMLNSIKTYTGKPEPDKLSWPDFEKLVRIYSGPHAVAGKPVSDVLYFHFCKPSEWQQIMSAIPIMEDMLLTEDMADALNAILPTFGSLVVKGKGLDVATIADNLRNHFIKLADNETVPPTSELVEALAETEEIPY